MPGHHFINYSTSDAADFVRRLYDALHAAVPPLPLWLDSVSVPQGGDWDAAADEALRTATFDVPE